MDPLTHTILGAACGLGATRVRELRRPAALAGIAGGLLPDADIFLRSASDPLFAVEYHRHFTHSLAFLPVITVWGAVFAAGLLSLFRRPVSWKLLLLPALLGGLSHLFCDVWTSYGTRLWWPFGSTRVALDWISVLDPVFTVPLTACVALALRYASRRAAAAGLIWASLYLGFCVIQRQRAISAMDDWIVRSSQPPPDRWTVKPSFGNVIVWRVLLDSGHSCQVLAVRVPVFGATEVIDGPARPLFPTPEAAALALGIPPGSTQARDIARFFHFSDDWVGVHPEEPLVLGDFRYSSLPNDLRPLWGIVLDPQHPDRHVAWETFRGNMSPSLRRLLKMVDGSNLPDPAPSPP